MGEPRDDDGLPDPGAGGVPLPEPTPRGRRLVVVRHTGAWGLRLLAALVFVTIALFFFLTRTDRGASLFIEQVLRRLPINGTITATGARSERLLEGVRLYGVAIHGDDGRLFLLADSARLSYDWRTLVGGDVVFDTLELWSPSVMLTRYPGESEFNVQRLFVSEPEARDTASTPVRDVIFRGVAIHGGEVRVLYPAGEDPGPRWVTLPSPEGEGRLVRHTFAGVAARLPSVVLQSPRTAGQTVEVDSLAVLAEVLEDPLRVRYLEGGLRYLQGRLDVTLDRLSLDASEAEGTVFVELPPGDEPVRFGFDVESPGIDLADLQWVDPRVPEGRATGRIAMEARGEERRVSFGDFSVASGGSRLRLDGALDIEGERFAFDELDVRASPLALARVEPWLEEPLPVDGSVEGAAELDGTLARLRTRGRLTLRRPGPGEGPITADFDGTLHLEEGIGFTDLRATLDPFDFGAIGELAEGWRMDGPGRVTFTATGRASDAIRFSAEIHHRPGDLPASNVMAEGSVRKGGDRWVLDIQSDVAPLSLTALRSYWPELPVSGEVSGGLRASGPLTDLTLVTDLETDAGRLAVTAQLDATDPGAHYSIEGEVAGFALSRVAPGLPDPTVITGYVDLEGRGTDPATLTLDARARLSPSRVGGLHVDTAALAVRVRDGVLHVDTLDGVFGGVDVQGRGTLAMEAGTPAGTVTIAFQSDSLGRLRPLFLGDSVLVRDDLSALERELLLAEGIDPDTLPSRQEVDMSGAVRGRVTLTGSVRSFAARGEATLERLRYGPNVIRGATVTFEGTGLPDLGGRLAGTVHADSLTLYGREFTGADLTFDYTRPRGTVDVVLQRHAAEDYTARAAFEHQGREGTLQLERFVLRFDSLVWQLEEPAVVAWNERGLRVQNLVLSRPGEDPLRIQADGLIPRSGAADFTFAVEGLRLERLTRLLQREELDLTGTVDVAARVTGTAEAPLITGTFAATELELQAFSLSRMEGTIDYGDRTLGLDVRAWRDSLQVLAATGQVPVDLAFTDVADRIPDDRQMDLAVVADSLPAGFVFGYVGALTEIEGTISGEFQIGGTVNDPSPTGVMALNDAGWTMDALGVRHEDIRGTLTLRPDGSVLVAASGRSEGVITVNGTVSLQPLTDPTFDLQIVASNFRAVARPDVEGNVTGVVTLTGTYRRPVVRSFEGTPVRVVEGVIYVEEFQRTAGVVDLADPAFFAVVDTSVVNPRAILGATANPFLRNLRVDVDLVVQRDSWLRSEQMNVEMGGELQVLYDRQNGDLVLLGDLQAVRGTYNILGRTFQVQSGTVEFVGTPGINPILNIVAATAVRPGVSAGEQITILATVSGTLQTPRVDLSSPDAPIGESDLVSYIVFGVPSYQLASGQTQLLEGAAGSLLGSTVGAVSSILQGTLAARLSSLVAREWGLDYFAITQPQQLGISGADLGTTLGSTTFEVGWYLEQDLFLTLLLRPLGDLAGGGAADPFGGIRLDWILPNAFTVQAFFEDRFLRRGIQGFDQRVAAADKVAGVFLFRDWGYGGPPEEPPEPVAPGPAAEAARPAPGPRGGLRRRRR